MIVQFLGTTVLSGLGSRMAAGHQSGTLRIPIRAGVDSFWNDFRTWLGFLGAAGTAFIPEKYALARGSAFTVGLGAATSIAATEQVRAVTMRQLQAGGGLGMPQQLQVVQQQRLLAPPVPQQQVVQQVRPVQQVQPAIVGAGYGVW